MKNTDENIRVAIVTDAIDTLGGAEWVLRNILLEYPNATVYCVRSDRAFLKREFPKLKVRNSFIHYLPFEKFLRKELYLLYPWAYRSFSFLRYDIVITISASFAKFIKPWSKKTKHIGYILTPPRFFWMHEKRSIKEMEKPSYKFYSFFISTFLEKIWQYWDKKAARRIDYPISISKDVQKRVKAFYDIDSDVIYPPVEVSTIPFVKDQHKRENWFLYLGRVESYKGVELAIRACVMAKKPLKVAGTGSHIDYLQELVKELNAKGIVKFLGFYTDEQKMQLLSRCKALISPIQSEDFGIVPVEGNAAGAPVIAHKSGGVLETISQKNPKTGVFFKDYTPESLAKVLEEFNPNDYDPQNCRKQATNFASEIFRYKIRNKVLEVYESIK